MKAILVSHIDVVALPDGRSFSLLPPSAPVTMSLKELKVFLDKLAGEPQEDAMTDAALKEAIKDNDYQILIMVEYEDDEMQGPGKIFICPINALHLESVKVSAPSGTLH